jgi:hypothetical protein
LQEAIATMKTKLALSIDPRVSLQLFALEACQSSCSIFSVAISDNAQKTRMDKKYAGDPDSPNFLPPSPLVDRQILSLQLESELKRVCTALLANEQSADDDLAVIAKYLAQKPRQDTKAQKHDKHSSFIFQPPRPYVPEMAATSFLQSTSKLPNKVQTQQKRERQEAAAAAKAFEPLEATKSKPSKHKSSFTAGDDEVLYEIRSKLDLRPKTSAAACIDYTEPTSPVHSNRTTSVPSNRTTYSTPFTSAGITPGQTSKRFSQGVTIASSALETEGADTTALPKFPDDATALDPEQTAQARLWMAEQLDKRRRSHTQAPIEFTTTKPLREYHPMNPPLHAETSRPPSRAGSIRNSISNGIREYIRPGSSGGSIHSYRSTTSTRSRTRQRLSALKAKISNASLRSRGSSRRRPGYDDGDEYFIDPEQVDLDRPLPPLPGLDSYKEKPKHIGLMMKNLISASAAKRDTKNIVIDDNGIERAMTADEEKQRQDDLARAVMEKMSMGSIGSVPTSPTGVITIYRQGPWDSKEGSLNRPITAGSGMGVGAVPLYKTYRGSEQVLREEAEPSPPSHPGTPRVVGGFVRKWGGRLGWGRKSKVVAII